MAKKRNKRRPADDSQARPAEAKPQFEYKPFPAEEISPEGWKLAQEYIEMCEVGGLARMSGSEAKREQRFRDRLSKIPYRHFSAALVRLQRGEQPPS